MRSVAAARRAARSLHAGARCRVPAGRCPSREQPIGWPRLRAAAPPPRRSRAHATQRRTPTHAWSRVHLFSASKRMVHAPWSDSAVATPSCLCCCAREAPPSAPPTPRRGGWWIHDAAGVSALVETASGARLRRALGCSQSHVRKLRAREALPFTTPRDDDARRDTLRSLLLPSPWPAPSRRLGASRRAAAAGARRRQHARSCCFAVFARTLPLFRALSDARARAVRRAASPRVARPPASSSPPRRRASPPRRRAA